MEDGSGKTAPVSLSIRAWVFSVGAKSCDLSITGPAFCSTLLHRLATPTVWSRDPSLDALDLSVPARAEEVTKATRTSRVLKVSRRSRW